MAKVVGSYYMSHAGWCYRPVELWEARRGTRSPREDVPHDDFDTNVKKAQRIQDAFQVLKANVAETKPDVAAVFGDDQLEAFDFNNFPAFAVYVGETFEGQMAHEVAPDAEGRRTTPAPRAEVPAHPELAVSLLTGLMKHSFDPAFCMDMPKPERGLGHAFMRPAESLFDMSIPIVPVLMNYYYAPQPTATRCYQLGRAIREIIEEYPGDLRVAVVGSGGLWHTPGTKNAYLDEDFDNATLEYLKAGDAKGMAEYFDNYRIPDGDESQAIGERGAGVTGMPGFGGPQGGTRETCAWITAAGVVAGSATTIVDYIPVYASPLGCAFAYSDKIS